MKPFLPGAALCRLVAGLFLLTSSGALLGQAHWVHFGAGGSLVYSNDNLGNHIIDYSYAGYEGGGVALPTNLPVKSTLSPVGGDNTAQIQNAINAVGALATNAGGIRGVVLLNPGTYNISGTLSISQSGVILSGSGTNTILNFTSTNITGTALNISGSSGANQVSGSSTYTITDSYVPLGATNFHLNSTSGLSVGMGIVVERPWTQTWINAIGMSNLWSPSGHQNLAERTITAIKGTQVTVDIPLPTPIEQQWCIGTAYRYTDTSRVQQCAAQNMTMVSQWGLGTTGDTNGFGWTAVNFGNAKNCWAQNIAFSGFGGEAINTGPGGQAKWITAQDCTYANGVNNGSARPGAFQIEGQMCLYQRLTGISGFEHLCQSLDEATGPNVFLYCNATGQDFDGGPHRFWAVSLLTDNEYGTVGNVHIVIITGGDNGWGAGYSVFYNCHTSNHTIQCPAVTNHYNWWIGGSGVNNNPSSDPGTYDDDGTTVAPNSLYLEQLKERLGGAAVENIGYPLFSLAASPSEQATMPGSNVVYNVTVGDPTTMDNTVALSVSGLPAGASAVFNTNAITGAGNATLTVTASNSIAPGAYPLTIQGASAGLAHTAAVTLVIGSFALSASPPAQTVLPGGGASYTVTLITNASFSGGVNFGLTGLPSGAGATFTPPSLATGGTSALQVTTTSNTPPGNYPLSILGTNGSVVAGASVFLDVNSTPSNPGTLVWTNAAADLNWSSVLNWTNITSTGYGPPGISNDVRFFDAGAVTSPSNVNNIVNGAFAAQSLQYANTNGYHTTLINPGQALAAGSLTVGTETDNGNLQFVDTVITGADGALNLTNPAGDFIVRQGTSSAGNSALRATLDMSGLDTFTAAISQMEIGALGSFPRPSGTLYLAKTNFITASGPTPAIQAGGNGGDNAGNGSFIYLGVSNAIFANGISIATAKQTSCSMLFNPALAGLGPTALFRGADGVSPVPAWFIADSQGQGGTVNTSGTNDFTAGTVDTLVGALTVARSSTGSGTGNPSGTLNFGAGLMSIGTLAIATQGLSGSNFPTGVVNVEGPGTLLVNTNLEMASVLGGTGAASTVGTLNINGGTVETTNIFGGGGTSAINLNGGALDLQGGFPLPGRITKISSLTIGGLLANAAVINVSNAIDISPNGTLAGNTSVTAPGLTVNGTISPGNGVAGAITTSAGVTLGAGGDLVLTVQDASSGPGTGWGYLAVSAALNVQANAANPFVISPQSYDPNNSGLVTNFNNDTNYNWAIATAAGGITNFQAAAFAVDSLLFENDLAGGYFYVLTNGNSLALAFTNASPPVALPSEFYRTGPITAIPIASLTNGWSDPDGDPVALLSVNPTSAGGAAVGTDGVFIYYTNAGIVSDTISYTVQDVRTNPPAVYRAGDTVRTAVGQIFILPPPSFSSISLAGSNVILTGTGGSNGTYHVLATSNLSLPVSQWNVIATNSFQAGIFQFTNAPAGQTFYLLEAP